MIERRIPVEELGWKNIGGRTWALPDGTYYTFKDGVDQVVRRFERGGNVPFAEYERFDVV